MVSMDSCICNNPPVIVVMASVDLLPVLISDGLMKSATHGLLSPCQGYLDTKSQNPTLAATHGKEWLSIVLVVYCG